MQVYSSYPEFLVQSGSGVSVISLCSGGFVILPLRRFGPAAAFALLNFLIGNRAIFYSAPMLWFGFGWMLLTAAKIVSEKVTQAKPEMHVLLSALQVLRLFGLPVQRLMSKDRPLISVL